MRKIKYECAMKDLCTDLQSAFFETMPSDICETFQLRKSKYYRFKFVFFVWLSILGFKHYNTMGILGYETFLLDHEFIWNNILQKKRNKKLLDIGAGNGSITKIFEPYTNTISCIEPSPSFQKILQKRGYILEQNPTEKYDIVTIFNVLDICNQPEEILTTALNCLKTGGKLIISLPFPICTRSWDNRKIRKTNHLCQSKEMSFEKGVSEFYTHFLKNKGLEAIGFTRLPYLVSLPDSRDVSVYDNGLFICQRAIS